MDIENSRLMLLYLLQFIRGTGPGSIRVIDVGGGGSNSNSNFGGVGAALFFALPILLLLGVGAGFLATNYCKL